MVADLHHEQDGVEDDEGHDEVLKGRGDDDPPQLVLETLPLFWHVSFQGLRLLYHSSRSRCHYHRAKYSDETFFFGICSNYTFPGPNFDYMN